MKRFRHHPANSDTDKHQFSWTRSVSLLRLHLEMQTIDERLEDSSSGRTWTTDLGHGGT